MVAMELWATDLRQITGAVGVLKSEWIYMRELETAMTIWLNIFIYKR